MTSRRVQLYASDNILEEFYSALVDNNSSRISRIHIPRSDVFYVRAHLRDVFPDRKLTLDYVERMMYLEGMLDRKDVLDPDRERSYG
jgi:hypothetical protein